MAEGLCMALISGAGRNYSSTMRKLSPGRRNKRGTIAPDKILTSGKIRAFQKTIWEYYRLHGRNLPWRHTGNPYHILVSEIMLQQTQVERVNNTYLKFIRAFPDFRSLAEASLHEVLTVWRGLGYNRRAISLRRIAHEVMEKYHATLPDSEETLITLPGIGKATASAIAAFAFKKPSVFIETNIRRVFLHCFFKDRQNVSDAEILPIVDQTLDRTDPRLWYYALMDYGAMLKGTIENPNRRSAHYQRQPQFNGSRRQIRGMLLREILASPSVTESVLTKKLERPPEKIREVLEQLGREGFIRRKGKGYCIE
jgi:A/G-specific adenine glycosylase